MVSAIKAANSSAVRATASLFTMFFLPLALVVLGTLAQTIMSAPAPAPSGQCASPLGAGTAGPNNPYWLETITHQVRVGTVHVLYNAYSSHVAN